MWPILGAALIMATGFLAAITVMTVYVGSHSEKRDREWDRTLHKIRCRHDNRVPVRSIPLPDFPEGELVAQWCPDCSTQLAADWTLQKQLGDDLDELLASSDSISYENTARQLSRIKIAAARIEAERERERRPRFPVDAGPKGADTGEPGR